MNARTKKIDGPPQEPKPGERRRLSRVRHDDRGNAYVEWVDAPAGFVERPKFEIERDPSELQLEAERQACDPYASDKGVARKGGTTTRTDLRKLSAWIKLKRELEEQKRDGDSPDETAGPDEEPEA